MIGAGLGITNGIGLGDGDGVVDGLEIELGEGKVGIMVCVGKRAVVGIWCKDTVGNDKGIVVFGDDGPQDAQCDEIVEFHVGELVGVGARIDGDSRLGDGDGIAEELRVCIVVGGSLLEFGNGIRDGTIVVGCLVGVGVGADNGFELRPGGVDGAVGSSGVATVVVCSLFGLGEGIIVWLGDELVGKEEVGSLVGPGAGNDADIGPGERGDIVC